MGTGTQSPRQETTAAVSLRPGGVHAPSLEILRAAVLEACAGEARPWVVSDVSLGGWRSHQVAAEFSEQLGLQAPRPPSATPQYRPPAGDGRLSYAPLISDGIDAEARGDAATLLAVSAADRIVAAVSAGPPRMFLVLAPRFGIDWEPEDLLFVRVLASRLGATASRLVLVYAGPPVVPAGLSVEWLNDPRPGPGQPNGGLLALVPGIVEPQLLAALNAAEQPTHGRAAALELPAGRMLIAPECRRPPDAVPRLEYDRLAAASRECGWVRAYGQYYGNNAFVEPQFLLEQAWQHFTDGGSTVALRLVKRAGACSLTPLDRAVATCQAQGMRIALHRFGDAAQAPDPPETAPAPLRSFLYQAKGYGLAMSGDAEAALGYFGRAQGLLEAGPASREYLYLLNISALAWLKKGDAEAALRVERDIEARAAALPAPDWRLRYITSINIARLCRRLGDLEAARRSYEAAFDTTLGVRSESEAVYTNVCTARLYADCGRGMDAFLAWLRAALHWAAAQVPEALGARVANSLIRSSPATPEELVDEVSRAILTSLVRAARESGHAAVASAAEAGPDGEGPLFVRAGCLAGQERPDWALGGPGWGVLGSSRGLACAARSIDTPGRRQLRVLLPRLMAALTCTASGAGDLLAAGTIVVDDRWGQELPVTAFELLESAVRLGAAQLCFEDRRLTLREEERVRLEAQARVRLGKAVAGVDAGSSSTTVTFKRSLPAAVLSPRAGPLLAGLAGGPALAELSAGTEPGTGIDELRGLLRTLEASRIVYLSFSEDSCTAAGISWRSKVSWPAT